MPRLVMLIGISGSGKSTYAEERAKKENAKVFSSDKIRGELWGDEAIQGNNKVIFDELHYRILTCLKSGKSVIYDATNLNAKKREDFLRRVPEGVHKEAVMVLCSIEECIGRQCLRKRMVPTGVIHRQACSWQTPVKGEGFDEIHCHYSGYLLYDLDQILYLNRDMKHDNPHHSLDIKDHMEKAGAICRDLSCDEVTRMAAEYHDIGKFFTKDFRDSKGNLTDVAHYYNHHNYGAYLMLCSSKSTDYYRYESAILINYHMDFFFRNRKGMEKLKKRIGDSRFEDLCTLHECDLRAH